MKKPNRYQLNPQLFAEETPPADQTPPADENAVKALKELQENTVPKEEYLKVMKQNKELWEKALNRGKPFEEEKKSPTIKELREDLYGGKKDLTNLEYCTKTLQLRKEIMEQGGTDPFVPVGRKIKASSADLITAEKIANELQDCIDAAGGDPIAFNNELRRRGLE
jgi:hypothetical protein